MGDWIGAVEDLVIARVLDRQTYADRSVLITGHTGFKGGWLAVWLDRLGAKVHGYALDPPTTPSFFESVCVSSILASDTRGDLADLAALQSTFDEVEPEIVFHLAAQPLVRAGYRMPRETMATNVIGTANVLEAARSAPSIEALVLITTDKVYENRESPNGYSETDPLGGTDPYSASKAAAEIVASCYRASYFTSPNGHPARVATARAGNVIGGGDWAADRLVPDCLRAFAAGQPVSLRFPNAVRPWQHVLEPLSGYLQLGARLLESGNTEFAHAWNFGPAIAGNASVGYVAESVARLWGDGACVEFAPSDANPHEAAVLRLDCTLARTELGWQPRWTLEEALEQTVAWHRAYASGADMGEFTSEQICYYESRNSI